MILKNGKKSNFQSNTLIEITEIFLAFWKKGLSTGFYVGTYTFLLILISFCFFLYGNNIYFKTTNNNIRDGSEYRHACFNSSEYFIVKLVL